MQGMLRHIALFVPDLRRAEEYYRRLFSMELIGREALLEDGLWYTLPFDKNWDDAQATGIDLGMLALRKDQIVLALFSGDAPQGQVFAIGLSMAGEEIAAIRSRLSENTYISSEGPDYLEFIDPYRIMWQLSASGSDFQTAGVFAGRWLEL